MNVNNWPTPPETSVLCPFTYVATYVIYMVAYMAHKSEG